MVPIDSQYCRAPVPVVQVNVVVGVSSSLEGEDLVDDGRDLAVVHEGPELLPGRR